MDAPRHTGQPIKFTKGRNANEGFTAFLLRVLTKSYSKIIRQLSDIYIHCNIKYELLSDLAK